MSSLATYLAKNYLTSSTAENPDSTRPKKRRKKDKSTAAAADSTTNGLVIADDDDDLILSRSRHRPTDGDDADESGPTFDTGARSAEFRRAKNNSWKPVSDANGLPAPSTDVDKAAADRILAQAAEDNEARMRQVDGEDGPTIAGETQDQGGDADNAKNMMAKPPRAGGLQTVQDTMRLEAAAAAAARTGAATESKASKKARRDAAAAAEETVYRDATGRRIDISMRRAEIREAEEEKKRQERRDKEAAMGDVQRREKQEKKQALDEAKFLGVARYADDESMNDEMKSVGRWGDPMLEYVRQQSQVERKTAVAGGDGPDPRTGHALSVTKTKKQHYQGATAPNRYAIQPGWRWDGVDRGNGFERDWFQARGRKSRNENLEYQWQMDE